MALNIKTYASSAPKNATVRIPVRTQTIVPEGQVTVQPSPEEHLLLPPATESSRGLETRTAAPLTSQGQRLAWSFQQLTSVNRILNDEMSVWHRSIRVLNEALSNIKLGVSGWYKLSSGGEDENNPTGYWSRELGWSQYDGKWQICLKKVWGDYAYPDDEREEVWPFEAAPRWLQLDAGSRLPDLIDVLIQRTEEMTKLVSKRKTEALAMITDLQAQLDIQGRA